MENNSLTLTSLSCVRGGREVFSNLSIKLNYGEALLVTGANGAGKTTLLRLLAGLLPSDAALGDVHFIGALDGVKQHLTVKENLNFWRAMENSGDNDAALAFWGLQDLQDMPARFLSSGQRKRLALCRLMLMKKKIWLLDEPHAALDSENQERLLMLLKKHFEDGGMAIIATHEKITLPNAKELRL